jgi:hypothetical protein
VSLFTASSNASGVLRAYVPVTLWIVWPSRSAMSYSCTCRPRNSVANVRLRSCQITPPSTVSPNGIPARSHAFTKPRRSVLSAYSCLRIIEDTSFRATINYFLQSCTNWTIHWINRWTRTFALCIHQKKPVGPHFYVSPVSRPKHRQVAEVDVFDLQFQQLRMLSNPGSK